VLGLVYAVKEGAANGLRVDIAVIGVGGVAAFICSSGASSGCPLH
jgi:hypothetical protein